MRLPYLVIALLLAATSVCAQSPPPVLTCPSATANTPLVPWPNCAAVAWKPPGPGLVVAVQRNGKNYWEPSAAVTASDAVFTNAPYNGGTSAWWPARLFAWTPPPPPGIKAVTLVPNPPVANPAAVTAYRVYSGINPTSFSTTPVTTITAPATSYSTPLLPAGKYYYRVTSVNAAGQESLPTGPILVTVDPALPDHVGVTCGLAGSPALVAVN